MAYKNGRIPASALKTIPFSKSWRLQKAAVHSLVRLNAAFKKEFGHNLVITYGYRTYTQQVALWNRYGHKAWRAARPGTSKHGDGLAADIGSLGGFSGKKWKWINAHTSYGWRRSNYKPTRTKEPWHWEYHPTLDKRKGGSGKLRVNTWAYTKPCAKTAKDRKKLVKKVLKAGKSVKWSSRIYSCGAWWCVLPDKTYIRAANVR